jgi:hypothetical protein
LIFLDVLRFYLGKWTWRCIKHFVCDMEMKWFEVLIKEKGLVLTKLNFSNDWFYLWRLMDVKRLILIWKYFGVILKNLLNVD